MTINRTTQTFIFLVIAFVGFAGIVTARTKETAKKKDSESLQRDAPTGVYDQQKNIVSSIDFWTTNYGIFGYNVRNNLGGLFWPRGTQNQYGFAGGAWFGALKKPLRGTGPS